MLQAVAICLRPHSQHVETTRHTRRDSAINHHACATNHLEHHLVRPVTVPQAELALEVFLQHALLLDALQQTLVHLLLIRRAVTARLLLLRLLALVEESLLAALLVRLLVAGKVLGLRNFVHGALVDAVEGDSGLGRNDVAGVDAAERYTVDLEGTGD